MTDINEWEEIARDPNAVKWDEERVESLRLFVENTKRLQEQYGKLREAHEVAAGHVAKCIPTVEKQYTCVDSSGWNQQTLYLWSDGIVTWKAKR